MTEMNTSAGPIAIGIDLRTVKKIDEQNDQVQLTEGEVIMNVQFNPNQRMDTFGIKLWCAKMYDYLVHECSKTKEDLERYNRKQRLKSIALTHLETFQMNAVKAVTFTIEFPADQRPERNLPSPSDGELVMTCAFNVGGRPDVWFIKRSCALVYEDMEEEMILRNDDFKKKSVDFEKNHATQPLSSWPEEMIMDQRKLEHASQAMGDAFYSLRQFQMFAVKAVTR